MARRAFGSATFSKTPRAPKVGSHGGYHGARVLSPKQFSYKGVGYRSMTSVGSMRITNTRSGTKISSGGGGFRFSSGGRMTHRSTIKKGG